MEKAQGIGGLFFRAENPKELADWYHTHFGINPVGQSYDDPAWTQERGTTVFAPFSKTTTYFRDPAKQWMVNFRVTNLKKMAAQLEAAGIAVELDPEHYPNGWFGFLQDPEGNPIQLWQEE